MFSDENATLTLHAPVHMETQETVSKTFQNENALQTFFVLFHFRIILMCTGKTLCWQGNRAANDTATCSQSACCTQISSTVSVFAALHSRKKHFKTGARVCVHAKKSFRNELETFLNHLRVNAASKLQHVFGPNVCR